MIRGYNIFNKKSTCVPGSNQYVLFCACLALSYSKSVRFAMSIRSRFSGNDRGRSYMDFGYVFIMVILQSVTPTALTRQYTSTYTCILVCGTSGASLQSPGEAGYISSSCRCYNMQKVPPCFVLTPSNISKNQYS